MLVLARKEGQKIVIRDDRLDKDIEIYVVLVDSRKAIARIGIVASDESMILREELSDLTKFKAGSTLQRRQQERKEREARRREERLSSAGSQAKAIPKGRPVSGPKRLPGRTQGGAGGDADRHGKD